MESKLFRAAILVPTLSVVMSKHLGGELCTFPHHLRKVTQTCTRALLILQQLLTCPSGMCIALTPIGIANRERTVANSR